MRFVDDDDLSFCLTISKDIKSDMMLDILGRQEALPEPQTFDDFAWDTHQPGRNGLLNVFEEDGFVITLENNGYMGVMRRTINKVRDLGGISHYVAIYHSGNNDGYQYVEVQDGLIVANFDPATDEVPDSMVDLFRSVGHKREVRDSMVKAVEYRMETTVCEVWLETPTATYLIDYRTDRH